MLDLYSTGPQLYSQAPFFSLNDQDHCLHDLDTLMGKTALLLCFIENIWQASSVRRVLLLERFHPQLSAQGTAAALVLRNDASTLKGFQVSSPIPVRFPLLADPEGVIHNLYNMKSSPGLILVDVSKIIRYKWFMPDKDAWPKLSEVLNVVQTLQTAV